MDVVQVFNEELQSLLEAKPPVSKAKMGIITRAAMKGVKFYKHIVQSVEKFIAKCRPEYKVPGLYVVDSIVRQSRHQFGVERDVYASRFSRNLSVTFNNLFAGCSDEDRPKIVRVLNLWQKNGVFGSKTIQPLLDMANPNSTMALHSESTLSASSPLIESSKQRHSTKYSSHSFGPNNKISSPSGKQPRSSAEGLRFSKNMLDFDYDEDDDEDGDETPTEAEPPLSSTLNKIEMEQRNRNEPTALVHQSSQLQNQQQFMHPRNLIMDQQPSTMRNESDPVLERWNRLIRQQSITGEVTSDRSASETKQYRHRSRSRSPPPKPAFVEAKEPTQTSNRSRSQTHTSHLMTAEREAERAKKCLPPVRDKHLTVCSSTLWLGHVPKTVSEADISDAFGEYGTISSIDLIPPRGCAYVCMDRRQDAKRALSESKDLKLNGSHVKLAWAPGKGFTEYKRFKDFWEADIGASYIPYSKIDSSVDFDSLEDGGVIDDDSMSMEMRAMREKKINEKNKTEKDNQPALNLPLPTLPILTQPPPFTIPPPTNLNIPPPTALSHGAVLNGIPFPPPSVNVPPTQITSIASMQNSKGPNDHQDAHDLDNIDSLSSPNQIEQQLNMTERQINMVEQQLSMIQQAQNLSHPQAGLGHPQAIFPQNQPNPLLFDMPQHHLMHTGQQMLDLQQAQQMPIFANPTALLNQLPPMLPLDPSVLNQSLNSSGMSHLGGRF